MGHDTITRCLKLQDEFKTIPLHGNVGKIHAQAKRAEVVDFLTEYFNITTTDTGSSFILEPYIAWSDLDGIEKQTEDSWP